MWWVYLGVSYDMSICINIWRVYENKLWYVHKFFFFCYSHKVSIIAYKINSVAARLINNLVNGSQVAPTDSSDDWFIQLDQAFIKHTHTHTLYY